MKKGSSILIVVGVVVAAAVVGISGGIVPKGEKCGEEAPIWPDYKGVTMPKNIAAPRFDVEGAEKAAALVESPTGVIKVRKGREVTIPNKKWKKLAVQGGPLKISVLGRFEGKWKEFAPFEIYISEDEIDPMLAYRLVDPGYELWYRMGIYQRNLTNYSQKCILNNSLTDNGCMNCHSFCNRDPHKMLFHLRAKMGGTYLVQNGAVEKLNTKTDSTVSALVYPSWHPSGKYVAFSVNDIRQFFHSTDPNRIEVADLCSDVVVYDVDRHEVFSAPQLKSVDSFETFPTFSPDGSRLYFCTSPAVEIPQDYKNAVYSLCSIAFDPQSRSFGAEVDTLYSGGSASFPRVSPDGRYLLFTRSDYGNFSIWHKEADLYGVDLSTGDVSCWDAFNGKDTDSYHSWSSNSRWVVFSSRRDDGLYTRPYIGHVASDGTLSKPFMIPARRARQHRQLMKSYNIPEFIAAPVSVGKRKLVNTAKSDGVNIGYAD
ncbi:MAG: PD40 domain-containing protein [Bacteroidales bacterium]|nr:PD40 domain-containing protein [Bacteroidales bacterium]